MYKPTASLIISTKDGINMITGIYKLTDTVLKFRQVVAGKTVLKSVRESDGLRYDDPLPLYTIRVENLTNTIDTGKARVLYYVNEENVEGLNV